MKNKLIWVERVAWIYSFIVSALTCFFVTLILFFQGCLGMYLGMILGPIGLAYGDETAAMLLVKTFYTLPAYIVTILIYIYGIVVAIQSFIYYRTRRKNGNYARTSILSLSFIVPIFLQIFSINITNGYNPGNNFLLYIFLIDFALVIFSLTLAYAKEDNKINLCKLFNIIVLPIMVGGFFYCLVNYRLLGMYQYFNKESNLDINCWLISSFFALAGFIAVFIHALHLSDNLLGNRVTNIFGIIFSTFMIPCMVISYIEATYVVGNILIVLFVLNCTFNLLSAVLYKADNKASEQLVTE